MDSQGERAAQVECTNKIIPHPGQYLLAYNPEEYDNPLGQCLFLEGFQRGMDSLSIPLLGPIPSTWTPGTRLTLRGPLGKSFQGYATARRLGIATFSNTLNRMLPLIGPALKSGADVAVFLPEHLRPEELPAAVEVHSIYTLHESLSWPTLLLVEIPLADLSHLRDWLKLNPVDLLPCPAQALILTPMPCVTFGDCGVCAVPTRKGRYRMACKEGPVFDLKELDW